MDINDRFPTPYMGFHYRKSDNYLLINEKHIDDAIKVMKQNRIYKLEINQNYFESKDLSFIKKFDFIHSLRILSHNINIEDIIELKKISELDITLPYNGMIDFGSFEQLKKLYLHCKNESYKSISNCDKLEELYLYKYPLNHLNPISNLCQLRTLFFLDTKITDLNGIESFNNLTHLSISIARYLHSIDSLMTLTNIETLFLEKCKKISSMSPIGKLSKLKSLNLNDMGGISNISFLKDLKNLEEIYFSESTNILNGDLSILSELKNKNLKKILFFNRKHYNLKVEDFGYKFKSRYSR